MQAATLTITSKNYSSWSMRGWLLARLSGLPFEEIMIPSDDPATRAEILLLAPSVLVPCLRHEGITVWDTLAIGEYLNEIRPSARLLPTERKARAHCRAICGEMHSGFAALRSALPMNLKASYSGFRIWARAQADIDRIAVIWRECINTYGGPYLFGRNVCMADAMFAPVVTRFLTYGVELDAACRGYCDTVMALEPVREWVDAALAEPEEIDELEAEF
ncbi:glutathione S-transferase family protein [Noviherbaspirillum soli]|uniref:glutathione S-transferase family protein n=1 Tax=Noviherbaspirillum soli TaxID=1064518 RepID=UPI00188CE732|nr:glutathione S-transferase family protein [Noviherbaspirillum soli]